MSTNPSVVQFLSVLGSYDYRAEQRELSHRRRRGARVKAARQKMGLARHELASAVGCSRPTIEGIELGRETSPRTLAGIAAVLGVTVGELEGETCP